VAAKPLPGPAEPSQIRGGLTGRLTGLALGCQRTLAANPHHPQALMGMSLVAMASGQSEAAIQMAGAAAAVAPELCTVWVTLGQALKGAGRSGEAEHAYECAIRLDGMNALARTGLGELKLATGRPEEAIREFDLALRRQPAMLAAHLGLGHALACMGRNQEALGRYEQALTLKPHLPEAEFAAGFVLARLGRLTDAEQRYRRALAVRPDFAAAWLNLGNLLREQGRALHADAALKRALKLRPDLVQGWLNLALLERDRRRPDRAESHLRRVLELKPDDVETHVAWCQLRVAERDLHDAWSWLNKAIARNPRHPEAVNMHGILLHNEGRFEDAVATFAQAEALGSQSAASNRGNSLLELGRDAEALCAHESAVERDPNAAGMLYNLALTRLRLGDWERGWPQYEARWRFREVHRTPRVFHVPRWPVTRWQDEPLNGRRILIHAEQGLGDTIQFSRYAALVAARGGIAILQVQAPLVRLMRSLRAAQDEAIEVVALDDKPRVFDLECPLMSLPAVFGTTVGTVPWPGAYLSADPELIRQKRVQFPAPGQGLRIGIAWAGNPNYKSDSQRSVRLDTLLPLLRTDGVSWTSLQKGEAAKQLQSLPAGVSITDASSADQDFAETAALIATLDLVVTTDTSIAHLAGAMAKPVWILLPFLSDWRWMQHIETTPWYPSARLFRQRGRGDWAELQQRVIAALEAVERPDGSVCEPCLAPCSI
jgi:tetratricopeptide (TPR) repeat protein